MATDWCAGFIIKSLYGLRQAAREWNTLFVSFLVAWGFVQSAADTCLFFLVRVKLVMIIVIWVNDIICADSDSTLRDKFAQDLSNEFPVEEKAELTWLLGIRVQHDQAGGLLNMSQELYMKDMGSKSEKLKQYGTTSRKIRIFALQSVDIFV